MKEKKTQLDKLYFGVVIDSLSFSSLKNRKLETYNLFELGRVKWAVAYWVASDDEFKKEHDLIRWCFGDVWGRCEYEFIVCPWPYKDGETVEEAGAKVDIFQMYVEPNKQILTEMVNSVSAASAKRYLSEERKRWKKPKNTK